MDTFHIPVLALLYLVVFVNAAVFKPNFEKRRPTFEKNYSTGFGKRAYFPGFGKRHHDSDNRVFHGLEKNKETSSSHELKMPYLDTDSIPEWKELEIFYPNSYDSYSKQNMNSDEDFGEPDSDNGYLLNNFNLLPYGADIQEKPFIEKNELRGIMSPIDGPADSSKMYNGFAEKINQGIVRYVVTKLLDR